MKPGAPFYIFHADSEGYNFRGACHDVGLRVRQCLVWKKNALVLGRQDYQWIHEPCLYGWKDGGPHPWYADRSQTTVMEFNKPKKNDVHPTMKPAEVVKLVNSTDFGTVISPAQVYRHFTEAGYRIASSEDSRQINIYRYVAWLVDRKNTPSEASLDYESVRAVGDRVGHNWRMPNIRGKRAVRHVVFDTNYWKSFVASRLLESMGDRGSLSLWG